MWANHYFASGVSYFGPAAHETPLLHYWSLAVEEQFYLLWPMIVYLMGRNGIGRRFGWLVSGLAVTSFLISVWLLASDQKNLAYFWLPSRFWELLVGGIVALYFGEERHIHRWWPTLAITVLILSFFVLNEASLFPGALALVPCICTVFLIIFRSPTTDKFLGNPASTWLGKHSYQIYLWHWPLLAFSRYWLGVYDLPLLWILGNLVACVALSTLGYRFVETRLRHHKLSLFKSITYYYMAPGIALILIFSLSQLYSFHTKYFDNDEFSSYGLAKNICHGSGFGEIRCWKSHFPNENGVLVIGDSHAAHFNMFFEKIARRAAINPYLVSSSNCMPIPGVDIQNLGNEKTKMDCKSLRTKLEELIQKFHIIVIAGAWDFQFNESSSSPGSSPDPNLEAKLYTWLVELNNQGKKVILVNQVPKMNLSIQRLELFSRRFGGSRNQATRKDEVNRANVRLKKLAEKFTNVEYFDVEKHFPRKGEWYYIHGYPLYFDSHHLNQFGSSWVASQISDDELAIFKFAQ